jgi:hypothetical protein
VKIRVVADGTEVEGDDIVLGPWRWSRASRGEPDRLLYLSIDVGYNRDPPSGSFRDTEDEPFPRLGVRLTKPVTLVPLQFVETVLAPLEKQGTREPAKAETDDAPEGSGAKPIPRNGAPIEREILLVARWIPATYLALVILAIAPLSLFGWAFAESFVTWFGARSEAETVSLSDVLSLLVPLAVPALGVLGVTMKFFRRAAVRYYATTFGVLVALLATAVIFGPQCLVVVVNRTNESITRLADRSVKLEPGESATLFSFEAAALEESGPYASCPHSPTRRAKASLSFLLRDLAASTVLDLCCKRRPIEGALTLDWPEQKTCEPDPKTEVVASSLTREPSTGEPSSATYLIAPFTQPDVPEFTGAARLEVVWPGHARGPYSRLTLLGDGFVRETRVRLPVTADPGPIYLPWRAASHEPPSELLAVMNAGRGEVGRFVCNRPKTERNTLDATRIDFWHSGPFIERLVVQRAKDLTFVSSFEAMNSEMVTEIPVCLPKPDREGDVRIVVSLGSGFQPEGWSLHLDGSGPAGEKCLAAGCSAPSACGVAERVRSVQIHLPDGGAWGRLELPDAPSNVQPRPSCKYLTPVRADVAGGVIVSAGKGTDWRWQRTLPDGSNERAREFWVCRDQAMPSNETYTIGLADGTARQATTTASGAVVVKTFPLGACLLDGRFKKIKERKGECKRADKLFGERARRYVPPECAPSSQVCSG